MHDQLRTYSICLGLSTISNNFLPCPYFQSLINSTASTYSSFCTPIQGYPSNVAPTFSSSLSDSFSSSRFSSTKAVAHFLSSTNFIFHSFQSFSQHFIGSMMFWTLSYSSSPKNAIIIFHHYSILMGMLWIFLLYGGVLHELLAIFSLHHHLSIMHVTPFFSTTSLHTFYAVDVFITHFKHSFLFCCRLPQLWGCVGLVVLPFHCLHQDLFPQLMPTYSVASHCVPWSKSIIFTCYVSSLCSCQHFFCNTTS